MERVSSTTPRYQRSGGGATVYLGLYLPTLRYGIPSGLTFENRLELSYQRYSHRQRQKSLVVVNGMDVALKIVTLILVSLEQNSSSSTHFECSTNTLNQTNCADKNEMSGDFHDYANDVVIWTSCLIAANSILCLISWFWRFVANNYLHFVMTFKNMFTHEFIF